MREQPDGAVVPGSDAQPDIHTDLGRDDQPYVTHGAITGERVLDEEDDLQAAARTFLNEYQFVPTRTAKKAYVAGFLGRLWMRVSYLTSAAAISQQADDPERSARVKRYVEWRVRKAVSLDDPRMRDANRWIAYGQIELAVMAGCLTSDEAAELEDQLASCPRDSATPPEGSDDE